MKTFFVTHLRHDEKFLNMLVSLTRNQALDLISLLSNAMSRGDKGVILVELSGTETTDNPPTGRFVERVSEPKSKGGR